MKIRVKTFGSLCGLLDHEFAIEASDTNELMNILNTEHPSLLGRKLLVAVNNTIIKENTRLKELDTVVLMPPYSGG